MNHPSSGHFGLAKHLGAFSIFRFKCFTIGYTNMYSKACLIASLCLMFPFVIYGIRLSATAPVTDVKEGGILSLHCQLWDFESSYRVILSRRTSAGSNELSWNDKIIVTDDSDIADRVYLAVRQLNDGSHVYFLSVTDITRRDEGQYSCKIINSSTYSIVSEETVHIGVRYFPTMSPICSAMGTNSGLVFNEGTEISLNCTSEQSNPPLTLQWSRSGYDDILPGSTPISNGHVISQVLKITLTMRDNNKLFGCKISNPYFAGVTQTCHLGPFQVLPNRDWEGVNEVVDTWESSPSTAAVIEPTNTVNTVDCLQTCSNSTAVAFYWIISTTIAGLLAVALCVAAIVLAFKYQRQTSGRKRLNGPRLRRSASLEDMYEKVDCRRDEERMVYMSLKQSMKPGNPVMYVQSDRNTHYKLPPSNEQQTRTYMSAFATKP